MGIVYSCDRVIWKKTEHCAMAVGAVLVTDNLGRRIFMPPPLWRVMDVPGVDAPVILCPRCGQQFVEAHKPEEPPRRRLGVLDGGKGTPEGGGAA